MENWLKRGIPDTSEINLYRIKQFSQWIRIEPSAAIANENWSLCLFIMWNSYHVICINDVQSHNNVYKGERPHIDSASRIVQNIFGMSANSCKSLISTSVQCESHLFMDEKCHSLKIGLFRSAATAIVAWFNHNHNVKVRFLFGQIVSFTEDMTLQYIFRTENSTNDTFDLNHLNTHWHSCINGSKEFFQKDRSHGMNFALNNFDYHLPFDFFSSFDVCASIAEAAANVLSFNQNHTEAIFILYHPYFVT